MTGVAPLTLTTSAREVSEDVCRVSAGMSLELMNAIFEQSPDCIKVISPQGRLSFMTAQGRDVMEIDDFGLFEGRSWWELWPAESQELVRLAVERAAAGDGVVFEGFCPTAKGTPRWWEVRVSPVFGRQGAINALVSISRDITATVRDRERLTSIAQEMRHRLKNAYAVATALAKLSSRDLPETQEFAEELAQRLNHVAAVQTDLLDVGSRNETFDEIVKSVISAFENSACDVSMSRLPAVAVDKASAQTLALVIGELCTNSMKYGAMGYGGSVHIDARPLATSVELQWNEIRDGDSAVPRTPSSRSGMRLMERMTAVQGGSFSQEVTSNGFRATLTIPLRDA